MDCIEIMVFKEYRCMFDILEHKVEVFACLGPLSNLLAVSCIFVNLFHLIIFILYVTTDKQTNGTAYVRGVIYWCERKFETICWIFVIKFHVSVARCSVCAYRAHIACSLRFNTQTNRRERKRRRRRRKKCMYKHKLCYFFIWNSDWWCSS